VAAASLFLSMLISGTTPGPKVPEDQQELPSQISTVDTFAEMGIDLTEDEVQHWNS
jgi:hypothetical protein